MGNNIIIKEMDFKENVQKKDLRLKIKYLINRIYE